MKLNLFFGLLVLAVAVQKGESSITRDVVEEALQTLNTYGGQVSNSLNDYFVGKLQNETEIQEWSVDIQVKVFTDIAKLAFSGVNLLKNLSIIIDLQIVDCIVDQEGPFLEELTNATRTNGWCNNRLAANLTRAFQGVSQIMVDRNTEFRGYLDELKSCSGGDDKCFTQYLGKVVAYIQSEFGTEGITMLTAVQEVIRVYQIMFGEDVPACNKKILFPGIADSIHHATLNIFECAAP
jgi:hypothetical protein